ncbi:Polysaccharide deacetylase [Bowdeniella nasicola]|uniref:Polysaccharide deacetylase n=1 Tax=Bowdeniella nasicola TaxID=208480 RepID=A0A1H3Y5S9_9ACTO|nr:Polysaccharide deacetylase [Bowdeniella nasicola]
MAQYSCLMNPPGGRRRRIILATICAVLILALGLGIGRALPRHLKPSERVAPRSEDVPAALRVETVFRTNPADKLVALTFDDGPDERWTPKVLDILAKHRAKATFFVIGSAVKNCRILSPVKPGRATK